MSSSQRSSSYPRPDRWKIPCAFGVLICLPLIIGAIRHVVAEPKWPATADTPAALPLAIGSEDVQKKCVAWPAEQAMLVACIESASPASQADQTSASELAAVAPRDSDDTAHAGGTAVDEEEKPPSGQYQPAAETDPISQTKEVDASTETAALNGESESDGSEDDESEASNDSESVDGESKDSESKDSESKDSESKDSESKDSESKDRGAEDKQEEPSAEDEQEIICCDAASEFEQWTLQLDETIQKAVANAIISQLETSTNNLDRTHARLERLLVETELYKMQIEHLRDRLKEWQPAEKEEQE